MVLKCKRENSIIDLLGTFKEITQNIILISLLTSIQLTQPSL